VSSSAIEYSDVQGLVRFGYNPLTEATFLLLRIRDATAASAWLASAPVSNAVALDKPPLTALQIAFTREGLEALHLPQEVVSGFSDEFVSGMCGESNRSHRLGDEGANSPEYWRWGGPQNVPHMLVMLYAQEGRLASWTATVKGAAWASAFDEITSLPTSDLQGEEPFGFKDGISQPVPDWERRRTTNDQVAYTNLSCLGEFLLGYPNEYGKYTDRPLLTSDSASAVLPEAEDAPGKRDLGRNGTYLVLRQLQQDVRGFWQFVDRQTQSEAQARTQLAASMVGRTRDGNPLVPVLSQPIEGVKAATPSNNFTYDVDVNGTRCPFGAHIRRANPRNADFPAGTGGFFSQLIHNLGFAGTALRQDIMSSTRFHRLLRRGRQYGPRLSPEQALEPNVPDTAEHGIQFICLNANISRQFEFVQGAWVMSTKFNGMTGESDPLLGNREPVKGCVSTGNFTLPQESGLARCIAGMPQFITVRGGAYFFLPGGAALKYLAALNRK
jgi:deferrochelatase/peroxidase EfeB